MRAGALRGQHQRRSWDRCAPRQAQPRAHQGREGGLDRPSAESQQAEQEEAEGIMLSLTRSVGAAQAASAAHALLEHRLLARVPFVVVASWCAQACSARMHSSVAARACARDAAATP